MLPPLARARDERRLGGRDWRAYGARARVSSRCRVLVVCAARAPGRSLRSSPASAPARPGRGRRRTAAGCVAAAVAQLFAGLAASALAALDDYVVAAVGFVARERARARPDPASRRRRRHRARSPAGWRSTALVALGVPVVGSRADARARARCRAAPCSRLARRWRADRRLAARESRCRSRCRASTSSACRFAAREGAGAVTSFGYAYLAGSAVVAVTAVVARPRHVCAADARRRRRAPARRGTSSRRRGSRWSSSAPRPGSSRSQGTAARRRVLGGGTVDRVGEAARPSGRRAHAVGGRVGRVLRRVSAPVRRRADGLAAGARRAGHRVCSFRWPASRASARGLVGLALALALRRPSFSSAALARAGARLGARCASFGVAPARDGRVAAVAFGLPSLCSARGLRARRPGSTSLSSCSPLRRPLDGRSRTCTRCAEEPDRLRRCAAGVPLYRTSVALGLRAIRDGIAVRGRRRSAS